jgi:cytidylate kinase
LDRHALGSDKYFKHLVMTITTIGQHGHAIILGRGANFILPPEKALRVKIVAPLKDRVLNLMKQQAIDKRLAQEMLNQAEKERHAFIRRFFHHEVEEPWNYDLILNLGSIGLAAAEEIVIHSLRAKFPAKNNRRTVPCQEKS